MDRKASLSIPSAMFVLFVILLIVFFVSGGITGSLIRDSLKDVPVWFWFVIGFMVLIGLNRRKK